MGAIPPTDISRPSNNQDWGGKGTPVHPAILPNDRTSQVRQQKQKLPGHPEHDVQARRVYGLAIRQT